MFAASHLWLVLGALLVLVAAFSGDFTMIALAVAALSGACVAAFTDYGALVQVGTVAVVAGVLGPVLNIYLRPLLRGPRFGVTGSGAEAGTTAKVVQLGDRMGVMIKHDFFPARTENGESLVEGQTVVIKYFEGITAIVDIPGIDSESDHTIRN